MSTAHASQAKAPVGSKGSKRARQLAEATTASVPPTRSADVIWREYIVMLFASAKDEMAWLRSAVKESERTVLEKLDKTTIVRADMPENHKRMLDRYRALKKTNPTDTPASVLEKPCEKAAAVPSPAAPSDEHRQPPRVAAPPAPFAPPQSPAQPPPQTKPPPPPPPSEPSQPPPLSLSTPLHPQSSSTPPSTRPFAGHRVSTTPATISMAPFEPPPPPPPSHPATRTPSPAVAPPAEPSMLSALGQTTASPPQLVPPPSLAAQAQAQAMQPLPQMLPSFTPGMPMQLGGMGSVGGVGGVGGMGGMAGGYGLQAPPGWSGLTSAMALVQPRPKKVEKFKTQSPAELMADLDGQLQRDKYAKHEFLSKHPNGSKAIVAAAGGVGTMQCTLCPGNPSLDAGKSAHGTLKHLASPKHFESWYKAKYAVEVPKLQMQQLYNQFAHSMPFAKCRPPRPSKRARLSLHPIAPAHANEPRPVAETEEGGLGDLESWGCESTCDNGAHAAQRSY